MLKTALTDFEVSTVCVVAVPTVKIELPELGPKLSWLLAFGVINRYNRSVSVIGDFLYRITEPALRPIRRMLPNFGGLDISPVILILILYFLRILIDEDLAPILLSIAP